MNGARLIAGIPTPYVGYTQVKPEWLDANGHMNVAHYVTAFDDGSEPMFADFDLGWDYTRRGVGSIFMVSSSLDFRREVLAGAPLAMTCQLLAFDSRRIHVYQEMFHREEGYLAAQGEFVFAHVSFASRRASPLPEAARARLAQIAAAHASLPQSSFLGRACGLAWKPQ
jgi:acyl-CoA thioester hydrolase